MGAGSGNGRRGWGRVGRSLGLGLAGVSLVGLVPPARAAADPWQHLPENTALVLLLDTTADTWGQLGQYQLFKLLEDTLGSTPSLPGLPYLPLGIDMASDVAPWVGDTVTVALLPGAPGTVATIPDSAVMVAPVADAAAFASFRDTVFELQATDPEVSSALGTEIYFWPAPAIDEDFDEDLEVPAACGPAEVGAEPCPGELDEGLELLPDRSGDRPVPAPGSYALRLGSAVGLPLTVHPLHDEGEAMEVEVPVPVPGFGPGGLAVAFLPDALVTAEDPAAIATYLQLRQSDGPTLGDSPEFRRTLANREQTRAIFAVYGNALELLNYDLAGTALPQADLPLPLPSSPSLDEETLQTLRSLNFGGTLEALVYPLAQGVQARGRYYYDTLPFNFGITPAVPGADGPLRLLPASTFLVMSGRDVAGFWRSLSTVLETASDVTREGLETARTSFKALTGLDLDDDLFGWMDGEVAIAAYPTAGGPLQHVGLGLLLQTSDRPAAESALAAVDGLLDGFGYAPRPRTVNQQPVTSFELFSDPSDANYLPDLSIASHGWVSDDTLAITSGAVSMARVMAPSPHDPLADFFLFEQSTAAFPRPNNGYFYLNAGATLSLAYELFGFNDDPAFETTKPFLGSIRSLSATTASTADYVEIQGQLGLAPRRGDSPAD